MVSVPALVIQGLDDPFGTLAQVDAIELGCAGPVERCILEECGHAPHRDRPEPTLDAMTGFVGRLA